MSNFVREEECGPDGRERFSRDWGVTFPWFRAYNEAFLIWLSGITLDRPEEPYDVPVIYQTPERAFAEKIAPTVNDSVDIPIISTTFTGSSFDRSRWMSPTALVFSRRRVGDKWFLSPRPTPWNFNYNVTVWARYQIDIDLILYRILSRFTPDSYIHPFGIASRITVEAHNDTSNLEPGDSTDRILRNDLTFKVEGFMPLPERQVGSISGIDVVFTNNENADPTNPDENSKLVVNFGDGQDISIIEGDFSTDESGNVHESPTVNVREDE